MHKIELRKSFTGTRRNRAGLSVAKGDVLEAELSAEQLAAFESDPEFVVTSVKPATAPKPAAPKAKSAKA